MAYQSGSFSLPSMGDVDGIQASIAKVAAAVDDTAKQVSASFAEMQEANTSSVAGIEKQTSQIQKALAEQLRLKQINADQALAATLAAIEREHQAVQDALQQQGATGGASKGRKQPSSGDVELDAQKQLNARMAAETERYDNQIVGLAEKAAAQQKQAWDSAFTPITSGLDRAVTSVVTGTATMQQAGIRLAESLVSSLVGAGVKMVTSWAENQLMMTTETEAQTAARRLIQTVADGGTTESIQNAVTAFTQAEAGKTAAAQSGAAERNAADATENEGFLARTFDQLARWLGLESGKTAASTAGIAQRSAANTAVNALDVVQAMGQIETAAAVASANAYAAYAELPPVALAAAAEAWATTMGFASGLGGGIASAAGGWGRVPADGMLAELHRNEMVLPASLADTIRGLNAANGNSPAYGMPTLPDAGAAARRAVGGSAGGGPGSGDVHVHLTPHFNVNSLDSRSAAQVIIDNKEAVMQAVGHGVRNGAHLGISSLRRR